MSNSEFPVPHDIETIPGTEGWERMYPYHYQFVQMILNRNNIEKVNFWFMMVYIILNRSILLTPSGMSLGI